jgi:uncharacterized SAM-binding protein YcdF (DUF218 family)
MFSKIAWIIWVIILFVKWNNYFQENVVQLNEIRQLKQYVQILEETIVHKSVEPVKPIVAVKQPTIMVVLGCAMPDLQQDRIKRALEFAEKKSDDPIIWFLTGGVKDAVVGAIAKQSTEASAMAQTLSQASVKTSGQSLDQTLSQASVKTSGQSLDQTLSQASDQSSENDGDYNVKIILDENARNTAENFANLKEYLLMNANFADGQQRSVVITTSEFHQARASKIFEGVFHDILDKVDITWNVSGGACPTCWADERIHMRNVEADVMRVLVR